MGMSTGLFAATAQATAVSLAGPEHRARAISVVVGGTTFAVALGAPLGSLIATFSPSRWSASPVRRSCGCGCRTACGAPG